MINYSIWCFWSLFHFFHSNVLDINCHRESGACYFYMHQTSGACAGMCACDCTHQMEKTVITFAEFFHSAFVQGFFLIRKLLNCSCMTIFSGVIFNDKFFFVWPMCVRLFSITFSSATHNIFSDGEVVFHPKLRFFLKNCCWFWRN